MISPAYLAKMIDDQRARNAARTTTPVSTLSSSETVTADVRRAA